MPRRNSFASRVKAKRAPAAPRTSAAAPRPRRTPSPDEIGAATGASHLDSNIQHPTSNIPGETVAKPPKPQAEPDDGFVAVGRVMGPFGLKGELRVQILTDNDSRFNAKAKLWAGQQPVSIAASRFAQGFAYVMLKGFHTRSDVDKFRHALLQIPEADLPPLPEGEYYRFQLRGLTVLNRDGDVLGTLDEIIETGANDVYRVHPAEGADVLLPALADVIVSVDLTARTMVVDPPDWR